MIFSGLSKSIKYITGILLTIFNPAILWGQGGNTAYDFLDIPSSAYVMGMGGDNVSSIHSDIDLAAQNPALIGPENDKEPPTRPARYSPDVPARPAPAPLLRSFHVPSGSRLHCSATHHHVSLRPMCHRMMTRFPKYNYPFPVDWTTKLVILFKFAIISVGCENVKDCH